MLRSLLLAFAMAAFFTSASHAATLMGVAGQSGNVYKIDTDAPQTPELLFSLGAQKDFAGLAFSPLSRTFFVFSRAENKFYQFRKNGKVLRTIQLDRVLTGGFGVGGPRGVTFDAQGRLYVLGYENKLYRVNLLTGKTQLLLQTSGATNEVEGLATLDDEAFLGVGVRSQVVLISRKTGETASIARLGVGDLDAMTNTIGGWIYMSESGPGNSLLHAYNPFTQTYKPLGWSNISELSSLEAFPANAR